MHYHVGVMINLSILTPKGKERKAWLRKKPQGDREELRKKLHSLRLGLRRVHVVEDVEIVRGLAIDNIHGTAPVKSLATVVLGAHTGLVDIFEISADQVQRLADIFGVGGCTEALPAATDDTNGVKPSVIADLSVLHHFTIGLDNAADLNVSAVTRYAADGEMVA